ncbi:hypothetical protein [Halorussus halophilus]|uniref:hypothetical protein n=1 Tax=Halorussus halophilus TaxID=2650975 RepID=UPI001300E58C|nr:hypothetical protein [Halorussus halophilus]
MSSDYERVLISDWHAIVDHLRQFFGTFGAISESDDRLSVAVGNAGFSVTKDGRVTAGMPLHSFEDGAVEALYFDHERDRIRIEGDDRSYEFRKP